MGVQADALTPVPFRLRLALSVTAALFAGYRAYLVVAHTPRARDFGQVWYAARALLAGHDPYPLIGPGRAFEWGFPLLYPLPAAVATMPFGLLPMSVAEASFLAIGVGCFAWALLEHGVPPFVGLLSAAMIGAVESVQWAPLLAASIALPPLGVFAVGKPTVGFAMFVARPTRWPIVGGVVFTALAFLLVPGWLPEWRSGFASAHHFAVPVLERGGVLALLALARWRRPEARLLVALACVPQTQMIYETLPLWLVPRTLPESLALLIAGYAAQVVAVLTAPAGTDPLYYLGPWLWMVYLPCVLMVLRRPNEGAVPVWASVAVAR